MCEHMPASKTNVAKASNTAPEKVVSEVKSPQEAVQPSVEAATPGEVASKGFLEILYDKINSVIGGDTANQYLCLTLPGTIVDPEKFKYDVSGPKPAHVKANESKLVNKLYDAGFIAAADNGKMLPNQYKTALSMLSPKLNKDLFELKNQLRKVLMTPYSYDFGDGIVDNMNVEQVFYRLYNDYVEEKSKWSLRQVEKRAELESQIIDPVAREDKYLDWYGAVAETERVHLEEKLGRVLNVFSPDDMNIINAILNCGVGGELEQARSTLSMVEELNPEGGYVYPVSLYPAKWFNLLESSFTGVDLLESPAALSQSLRTLQLQRKNVLGQINRLISTIPSDEKLNNAKKAYAEANASYDENIKKCVGENLAGSLGIASAIVDMCIDTENTDAALPDADAVERVAGKEEGKDKKIDRTQVLNMLNLIGDSAKKCCEAQSQAVTAGTECVKAAIEWTENKNKAQLRGLLIPLQSNLESLNNEIEDLKNKIIISRAANKEDTGLVKSEANTGDVMPNKSDDYFTQIMMETSMSALQTSSSESAESSTSNTKVSFFIGGYSTSSSSSSSTAATHDEQSDMKVQVGMNVAKVQIERSWFDPGVFKLSQDMFSFSGQKIAPKAVVGFNDADKAAVRKRFNEMNDSVFAAFPVAFVIAKDVSIKFTSTTSVSSSFAESVEEHASKGGGFLCFSSNSSNGSASSMAGAVANSSGNSVTIRFTAPQILGYYMQAIDEDKSTHINDSNVKDISIVSFISNFKLMLEEHNKMMEAQAAKAVEKKL